MCFLRKKYDKARDLLIQTKTLPAELIIAELSIIKFRYDIARPENSEDFHGYLILHQNTRTKHFKIREKFQNQLWNEFDYSSIGTLSQRFEIIKRETSNSSYKFISLPNKPS